MVKVLVIGLDGATWNLLEPWAKEGILPTIKWLMDNGAWGKLESTIPFSTFPAWKCYSTGKNPGKLGVFHFLSLDMKARRTILHNARDFKSNDLWDYLNENGFKCGIINMPGTYPVKEIDGLMIAGFPAEDHDYTYPPSLEHELKTRGYTVHPKIKAGRESLKKERKYIKSLFSLRFKLMKEHLNDLDFLHLTISLIDYIQHLLWNDSHILMEYWVYLDTEIKKLLDCLGEDEYVFLMSDHGFTKLNNNFFLNNWLLTNGYLTLLQGKRVPVVRLLPSPKSIFRMCSRLHLRWVLSLIPEGIKAKAKGLSLFSCIDWDKTKAVGSGNIGIEQLYINRDRLEDEEEYTALKKKLKKELENIKDPLTGQNAIRAFEREEVYKGPYVSKAPDLIIVPESGYQIVGSLSNPESIWGKCPMGREAFHERYGIFLVYGPNIKKCAQIQDAKIYDIAPTILHIFGLHIPKDMDGRVLKEIFEKDSELAKRPMKYQEVDEKEKLSKKIKKLKNVGKI